MRSTTHFEAASLRGRLAAVVEAIIDALDDLDAVDEDLEDDDPAEDGGDFEPDLAATLDVDQRIAWGADRGSFLVDGEASGTVDDIEVCKSEDARRRDQLAARDALAQLRSLFNGRDPPPAQRRAAR